ncbi:hypothetical protein EVA_19353 [gut metagenome]|uniref:Uncharacterized protein n=1 Tax=gut metagenome TaxID=749906 RepID=J9FCF2_9ZZZZ
MSEYLLHTIHNSLSTPQVSVSGSNLKVTTNFGEIYIGVCLTYM